MLPSGTRYSIAWQQSVDPDIETRYPIRNTSFLAPLSNVPSTDCEYAWDESDICWEFTTVAAVTVGGLLMAMSTVIL